MEKNREVLGQNREISGQNREIWGEIGKYGGKNKIIVWFRIGDFTLRLKFTSATDAGKFECQVSTNPKISQVFSLKVVGKVNFKNFFC